MNRNRKPYNYSKLWIDRAAPADRATAYAYWEQASRFEQAARERGDVAMVNFQKRIRIKNQNILIAWDAMEGGNI